MFFVIILPAATDACSSIVTGATKTELSVGITEAELEERLTEFAGSIGGSSRYLYEMQDSSATMRDLINYIESRGYISNTLMLLQLEGAGAGKKYIGSINFFAGNGMFTFNLLDVGTATLYVASTSSTSTTIVDALENATKTELGGSSSGGIIDVEEFPNEPSTSAIYRKWQVTKAEWVMDGVVVTDGGMTCEVVNTLPETGEMCYTETSMYSYYCRADNEVYGYVDSNLSAMMSVPVGWYPAATLFGALGYTYNGIVESIENVSANGYSLLLTKKPHLYHFYDDGKGNNVKSAIITNDNYEFDEATGTLTQHIIL